jgi:hypothetical protein
MTRRRKTLDVARSLRVDQLEDRTTPAGINPGEIITTGLTATQLATMLVGSGVAVSNATFTGNAASSGSFSFSDPTVVGFSQGVLLTSGSAADVAGPNTSDSISTSYGTGSDLGGPGDADLNALSGFTTYDAAVLEFDFVPTANQVVFQYAFSSEEYPEWVNSPFNDVFAFFVNQVNYATVRKFAGDPTSPFVPVAVNNINDGNPADPTFTPVRPDLFRPNYFNPNGPSAIDLEQDGITRVLTFQAPVNPGVVNHMKLAIADASDGILDSAVFIQSGSLVSNENPVADLSLSPSQGSAPLLVTAIVEGEDPNGLPLTYTINWGDGSPNSTGPLNEPTNDSEKTALVEHTYATGGDYIVTLTVSNGSLSGVSQEDVNVTGTSQAPSVTSIAPFSGPTTGGTTVIITGTGFIVGQTSVTFGPNPATNVSVNPAGTQITATTPAAVNVGTVEVVVTTPAGSSSTAGTANDFTYSAAVPTLASFLVNGGPMWTINSYGEKPTGLAGKNSIVEQLYVEFDIGVTIGAGAFTIDASPVNQDITPVGGVAPVAAGTNVVAVIVEPDATTLDGNGGYKGYRLRFSGSADYLNTFDNGPSGTGGVGNISTTLKDGFYKLNINGAAIHAGNTLAGPSMPGMATEAFWVMYASYSLDDRDVVGEGHSGTPGDGTSIISVNASLVDFAQSNGYGYGTSLTGPLGQAYNANFDWNLDGDVGDDLIEFAKRFGAQWSF